MFLLLLALAGQTADATVVAHRVAIAALVTTHQSRLDRCAGPAVVSAWWRVVDGHAADIDFSAEPPLSETERDCLHDRIAHWAFDKDAPRTRTTLLLQAASLQTMTPDGAGADVAAVLVARERDVQRCMEDAGSGALLDEPVMDVRFALQSDGAATAAQISSRDVNAARLEHCVAKVFATMEFPSRPGVGWRVVTRSFRDPGPPKGRLRKEQIQNTINQNVGQIQYCFERQLKTQPDLHGRVVLRWKIQGDGAVKDASVNTSSMPRPEVETCMVQRVLTWTFPRPDPEGDVIVIYPFVFNDDPSRSPQPPR